MSASAAQPVVISSSAAPVYSQPAVVYAQPQYTYASAAPTYYTQPAAAAPAVSYSYAQATPQEPTVTYMTAPQATTTYVTAAPQEQQVTYAAPQGATYVTSAPQVYAAPQVTSTYAGQPAQYAQYQVLAPAESMVAYPGMPRAFAAPYNPTSVQAAWENHFEAFGKQDLDKIMLDYDDYSVVKVFNNSEETLRTYEGPTQIREFFAGLFRQLINLESLKAPVVQVEQEPKTVFLCWECPDCGFKSATDTFVFDDLMKIRRQHVVVTNCQATAKAAPVTSATAVGSAKKADTGSKKKGSKKSTSSKKKSKACC